MGIMEKKTDEGLRNWFADYNAGEAGSLEPITLGFRGSPEQIDALMAVEWQGVSILLGDGTGQEIVAVEEVAVDGSDIVICGHGEIPEAHREDIINDLAFIADCMPN